ncbi:MAG: 3-oxoacyl-ACP reductase FabG [Clostridia bacterium]|nr:3-oxoacyl-ACP reductase FabG [Clostridia bacterium]
MEENKEENIQNKVIIVTGGSRGIGSAIVKLLANEGNSVVLNYNQSKEIAENTKRELKEQGKEIDIFKADVSKREEVKELIKFVIEKYKKIDVLINNAGISQVKLFTQITDEEWDRMIQTNLNSVFYCTQEALKHMIAVQSGAIINISSIWGITGGSCEVHYSAAKAGIDGMTKALAKELGPSRIRVNSIAPGVIDTDMNKDIMQEELKSEIPLESIGKAEDIAKCVKWLIEDEYTTGQVISINGGWYI